VIEPVQIQSSFSSLIEFVVGHTANADGHSHTRRSVVVLWSSLIPSFRRSVVPSFRRSVVPSFRRSVVPSFRRSVAPSFRRSVVRRHRMSPRVAEYC